MRGEEVVADKLRCSFVREEEEQIVTPFAQILATLKDVRSNLATMVSMQAPTETSQTVSGSNRAFLDKFRLSSKCQILL